MSQFAWNGPICPKCNGSGAVTVGDLQAAEICKMCEGSGLGKIGHGSTMTSASLSVEFLRRAMDDHGEASGAQGEKV